MRRPAQPGTTTHAVLVLLCDAPLSAPFLAERLSTTPNTVRRALTLLRSYAFVTCTEQDRPPCSGRRYVATALGERHIRDFPATTR